MLINCWLQTRGIAEAVACAVTLASGHLSLAHAATCPSRSVSPAIDSVDLFSSSTAAVAEKKITGAELGSGVCSLGEVNSRYHILYRKHDFWVPTYELKVAGGLPITPLEQPRKPFQGSGTRAAAAPTSSRASNIDTADTRSDIAPQLPVPDVNGGPEAYLAAAERALARHQIGLAQEALERAETRLLDRSVPMGQGNAPDRGPRIDQVNNARKALASRDYNAARQNIQQAMNMGDGSGMGQSGMGMGGVAGMGMSQPGMSGGQMMGQPGMMAPGSAATAPAAGGDSPR